MTTFNIAIGIPNRCLSPNARPHWAQKNKAKQVVRDEVITRLREAIAEDQHWPACRIDVAWYGETKQVLRMDSDNIWGSLKTHRDCLEQHGLVKNDNTVRMGKIHVEVDVENPCVVLVLTREEL